MANVAPEASGGNWGMWMSDCGTMGRYISKFTLFKTLAFPYIWSNLCVWLGWKYPKKVLSVLKEE